MNKSFKLMFSGGGTLGPVTPLVAIINKIKKIHLNDEIFWVSTINGIENKFLNNLGIKTYQISSAKFRRYFSLKNFSDIYNFKKAILQSHKLLKKMSPDIVISAGGFVSVPLVIVSKILGKKILVHQQDVKIGLANKLMFPFADKITVTFEDHLQKFKKDKAIFTGNPCRFDIEILKNLDKQKIIEKYNFNPELKIVLILGGSSGANDLNEVIYQNIDKLTEKYQIIHVTGNGKHKIIKNENYYQYEFIEKETLDFMFVSDLVVSRSGLGTLTELSFLEKCAILLPLKGHQELNAKYFLDKNAVELANEQNLIEYIFMLLENKLKRETLSRNISSIMPKDATENIIDIIYSLINKS
ncbi:MAG: UDP-N-acetylglucosamine--N-acetylmuramyl-(pentapeptide) pyrophosphoryl-undecaprenol N-acetylglucosamine transferase [Patescibacteria group bacterium]|nr:UDP-N-acetylglucosamine--N-acetylmuramyl-(pentapeptide) pyrophosphoryl-undecaprenol N-acetylglucosamine transferase [Patescibacteria group bacterium]MDD4304418.1 UDP-N-acetylglucosamine--N-acetylmuramyl-(pentapeptide) pyrophosphoryl-undecaprenol N-acetylglucosamine transferase [Patescibacteria group bacterium]MDD4695441.1 UDP-N-acetylglucosamine--N-acetylmuramyl-(pentapeptide) pyrophosphoryl-undecaprenol N-acetylglucosamine transferase [Patescibacteria group bacterium]